MTVTIRAVDKATPVLRRIAAFGLGDDMQSDNIKLLFTYIIALVTILGGGIMLYAIRLDPPESGSATLSLAIVGFIGLALGFVFNRESATQATRAAQTASSQGAAQALINPGPSPE